MKELIIVPKVSKSKMGAFLAEIKQDGVKTVYADPKNIAGSKMDALWTTYVIIKNNATKYISDHLILSGWQHLLHIKAFCAHV